MEENRSFFKVTDYFQSGQIKGDVDIQAKQSWIRELGIFSSWIRQTTRKIRMAHDLFNVTTTLDTSLNNESNAEFANQLQSLHYRILRNNSRNRTSFIILFDLYRLIDNWGGSLIEDSDVVNNLILLLNDWERSPGFEPSKFEKMKSFLRMQYCASESSIRAIYEGWLESDYVTWDLNELVADEKRFLYAFYFSPLEKIIESKLKCDSAELPSVLEVGQDNFDTLLEFLDEFSIPHAGPFRKTTGGLSQRLQIFISSVNPADAILNRLRPLFGIFEFKISSLNLGNRLGVDYTSTLPVAPSWLSAFPPFLSGTRDQVIKYLTI